MRGLIMNKTIKISLLNANDNHPVTVSDTMREIKGAVTGYMAYLDALARRKS